MWYILSYAVCVCKLLQYGVVHVRMYVHTCVYFVCTAMCDACVCTFYLLYSVVYVFTCVGYLCTYGRYITGVHRSASCGVCMYVYTLYALCVTYMACCTYVCMYVYRTASYNKKCTYVITYLHSLIYLKLIPICKPNHSVVVLYWCPQSVSFLKPQTAGRQHCNPVTSFSIRVCSGEIQDVLHVCEWCAIIVINQSS